MVNKTKSGYIVFAFSVKNDILCSVILRFGVSMLGYINLNIATHKML